MKRWLLLLLLLVLPAAAQTVGPGWVNYVTSAPSGACSNGEPLRSVIGLGTVYSCQSGTWAQVGGGAASCAEGTCVVNAPIATQTVTQPVNTDMDWALSGTGSMNIVTDATVETGLYVGPHSTSFEAFAGGLGRRIQVTQGPIFSITANPSAVGLLGLAGSEGTIASPSKLLNADYFGEVDLFGYGDNGWHYGFSMLGAATGDWTGSTFPSEWILLGGDTTSKLLRVDQSGNAIALGRITGPTFSTSTNCAAVGTAANPSVASCAAAASGAFSCATNASAGTCQVNTTAVTANSRIIVQESATEGANLGVTCNTAPTVVPAILLASKSAGASFTINSPTYTVNPACFVYWVVN